ncbi:MAG TPA: Spy/CpxP family protein refolding chaperone [Methylomirabilota bacterium]|nr:Spy/CpxP family protein refolding chaperone [Methylomirabilota bacterium]
MVHARCILAVAAVGSGLLCLGCSQDTSRDPVPTAGEELHEKAAEGPQSDGQNAQWWRDEAILAELQLTEDQLRAIHTLMDETTRHEADQRQRERQLSMSYLRTLAQDPVDPAVEDRIGERLIEVLSERSRLRIENLRSVREILTGEQWQKLWEVAPRALQIGRYRVVRGPRVSLTAEQPDGTTTTDP